MHEETRAPARMNVNRVRAGEERVEMSDGQLRADTARSLGAAEEDREGRAELTQRVGDGRLDVDPSAPETVGQRMARGTLLDRAQEEPVERLDRIGRLRQLRRGASELFHTACDGRRHELVFGGKMTVQRPQDAEGLENRPAKGSPAIESSVQEREIGWTATVAPRVEFRAFRTLNTTQH
jgi:hypothetical protein